MPLVEIKKMTPDEQGLMIKAIVDKPTYGGRLHFNTIAEYEKWYDEQQRNGSIKR